jgi:hypothetical protein
MPQRSSRVSAEVIGHSKAQFYYVIDVDCDYITAEVNDPDDLEKWERDLGVRSLQ